MSIAKGILDELDKQYAFSVEEEKRKDRILDVLIPQLKGDKIKRAQVDKIAESAVKFYSLRTTGLEEDERKALLNIVQQNPAKALSVYTEVIEAEKKQGQARIVDNRLVNFYDLVDVTKPENMTREKWVRQAATMATDPDINTYDDMMMKLMDPDLSLSEIKNLSREYTPYVAPASDPTPDFDYSAIDLLEPSFIVASKKSLVASAIGMAAVERSGLEGLRDKYNANEIDLSPEEFADIEAKITKINEDIALAQQEGAEESILRKEYGKEAFKIQAPNTNLLRIPEFKNDIFSEFFDADGKYIGNV